MTEITDTSLIVLFLLWICIEGSLGDGMNFGALLRKVYSVIAIIWISLAVWKSQARAKVRAKLPPVGLPQRSRDFPAMS